MKTYDELYKEMLAHVNVEETDQSTFDKEVALAYADQQVKVEREKVLQEAIDTVTGMKDRSFYEDYIDAYKLVINQLESLKIKQP